MKMLTVSKNSANMNHQDIKNSSSFNNSDQNGKALKFVLKLYSFISELNKIKLHLFSVVTISMGLLKFVVSTYFELKNEFETDIIEDDLISSYKSVDEWIHQFNNILNSLTTKSNDIDQLEAWFTGVINIRKILGDIIMIILHKTWMFSNSDQALELLSIWDSRFETLIRFITNDSLDNKYKDSIWNSLLIFFHQLFTTFKNKAIESERLDPEYELEMIEGAIKWLKYTYNWARQFETQNEFNNAGLVVMQVSFICSITNQKAQPLIM